uniref:Mobile element protein n=1 Tax=Klebsiella pneumoniae TaxID=573 RepID=A0A8B0SQV1_KLEPN|nr:Mobile element protein [Klebsiella pneumoniae]
MLRGMNTDNARKLPADAPTGFIKPRWQKLVMTDAGIDRRYYELCALSELKNSLRSGDIWVQGFTPVQGLRGLHGTAREVHQPQAVQRIAAGRGHRLRTISA